MDHDVSLARRLHFYGAMFKKKGKIYETIMESSTFRHQISSNVVSLVSAIQDVLGKEEIHAIMLKGKKFNSYLYTRGQVLPVMKVEDGLSYLEHPLNTYHTKFSLNELVGDLSPQKTEELLTEWEAKKRCCSCGFPRTKGSYSLAQWNNDLSRCRTCVSFLGLAFYYHQTIVESLESALRQKVLCGRWIKDKKCVLCASSAGYSCSSHHNAGYCKMRMSPMAFSLCSEGTQPSSTYVYHNIPIVLWTGGIREEVNQVRDTGQLRASLLSHILFEGGTREERIKMGRLPDLNCAEKVEKIMMASKWFPEYSYAFLLEALTMSGFDEEILSRQMQSSSFLAKISHQFSLDEVEKEMESKEVLSLVESILESTFPYAEDSEMINFSMDTNQYPKVVSELVSLSFCPERQIVVGKYEIGRPRPEPFTELDKLQ
jgi:hypothetical protein